MTLALAGVLLVLALIDSTSFGTLLIPLWLMLSPGRLRAGRILLFLGVVASVYLALGIVLSAGLEQVLQIGNGWVEHPFVIRGQFVLGLGLLIGSFFIGRKKSGSQAGSGRLQRWRDRAMADGAGSGTLIGLAMGAVVLEVATMLPYLGAIGLLSTSTLPLATRTVALVGYCLVMVAPALLLLLARILLHHQVAGPLQRLATWMQAKAGETTAWIVGIVGFLIARDAVGRMPEILGFLDNLG
ncbi:MAG TPA: GAP family protein [Beutenbergiaceae bacterium]|nr:GAP family protein [Beutenbergiaceae bacterium]